MRISDWSSDVGSSDLVQAFLVHQARNHGEQRAAGVVEAEQVAYMSSIHCLALPVAHGELAEQVRIGGRVPTLIDAIGNAAEQALLCFGREKTVEPTAKCRGGD